MTYRALIIDDNGFDRHLVASSLQHCGFEVLLVQTGVEGRRLLSNYAFDLLVLDLRQPSITAVAVLEWVGSQPHLEHMFTLVMAAPPAPYHLLEMADHVMVKPPEFDDLLELAKLVKLSLGHNDRHQAN